MVWRKYYMDIILVPLGLLVMVSYHILLWHKVRTRPETTTIGINSHGRRFWVHSIIQDNEKRNILAVQTLRNSVMGTTLMATSSILLCAGLAAVISSTYSIKKPLNDSVYGAQGDFMVSLKYVTILTIFLFSFLCYSLSIKFINQVNFLVNCPWDMSSLATPSYIAGLLERGFLLNTIGNRLFYSALPLLLWIVGPVLVFFCFGTIVLALYNLDFVVWREGKNNEKIMMEDKEDVV